MMSASDLALGLASNICAHAKSRRNFLEKRLFGGMPETVSPMQGNKLSGDSTTALSCQLPIERSLSVRRI